MLRHRLDGRKFLMTFEVSMLLLLLLTNVPGATAQKATVEELRFEFMVLSWDDFSVHTGEVIADQLAKIGIKFDVTPLDDAVMYPRIDKRDYWVAEEALSFDPVPLHLFYWFHSGQDFEGGPNLVSYRNPEYDKLIDEALSTTDMAKVIRMLREAQAILAKEWPYIPLWVTKDVHVFSKGWRGIVEMPSGTISYYNRLTVVEMNHPEKMRFVILYPSFPGTLNPMPATDGRSLFYDILIYDSLLTYDKDLKLMPWLAESWSLSPDGKAITFRLREGVKWHDGRPLTAEDVKFTFDFAKANDAYGSWYVDLIRRFDSVEVVDARTVLVKLKAPYIFALNSFGLAPIVPKHIWEKVEKWDWPTSAVAKNPSLAIGSGPFKFAEMVEGDYIRLIKNADYWLKGRPLVEEVLIKVIDTQEARVLAIRKGEADTERYELPPAYIEPLSKDPKVELYETASMWPYLILFNLNRWPMNVTRFREAIAYALDLDEIVKRAALGVGLKMETWVPSFFYGPDWENPEARMPKHDPEKAKRILAELGFKDVDGDGILEYAPAPPAPPFPLAEALIAVVVIAVAATAVYALRRRRKVTTG